MLTLDRVRLAPPVKNKMMHMMMTHCCDAEGRPDFEKMKGFMIQCGKHDFSSDETSKMKEFSANAGKPDFEKMKAFMEHCGCCLPDRDTPTTEVKPSA